MLFPADDVSPLTFTLSVPPQVGDVASAEIWLGHLSHADDRLERVRGRIMWTADEDRFDLMGGQNENAAPVLSSSCSPNALT